MLRLADLRAAALVVLAVVSAGACASSAGGPDAGPAPTTAALAPVPAPAGLLGELFVPAPGATWGRMRGMIGGPAVFLPQGFGAFATTLAGLPITVAAEIDDAVPVVGAAVRRGKEPMQAVVGLHVKAGDRLLDMLTRGDSARFTPSLDETSHVTLLTEKVAPEASRVALGVLGNYLLVAQKPANLFAVGPYVARTLPTMPQPKEEVAIELPEAALAGPIVDAIRDLRAAGDGPVATLIPLGGLLDHAIELLSDASHARVTASFEPDVVRVKASVTPKPGAGPGAKLVTELTVGDARPLLDLPDATSLGLFWREAAASRRENATKQADALARVLGGAMSAEDRDAMAAALGAEAEARGDWQAVGIAINGTGPTAVVRAPVADADRMKKALRQLLDLSSAPSFKKLLAGIGLSVAVDKAVVENLAAEVTRARLARTDGEPARDPKADKAKADAKKGDKPKPAVDSAKDAAPKGDTPKAIDLLYFVDKDGLFAAAGYDPKDALRALVKAPGGASLASNALMAQAIAAVGDGAAVVLVADAVRIDATTSGKPQPAASAPMVLAAGRALAPAELWARADLPVPVLQLLINDYARRRPASQ